MLFKVNQFEAAEVVAVSLMKTSTGDMHSGIIFNVGSGSKLIHLASEKVVESIPSQNYSWVKAGLDESVKKVAAGMCAMIAHETPEVPYAFDRAGWSFDANGKLVSGAAGKGMTCSTFIVAVFDAIKYPLIKEDQWPRGTDGAVKLSIFSMIFRGARIESDHAIAAMNDAGSPRILPTEVAASSSETSFPVPYLRAKRRGRDLQKKFGKLEKSE